MEHICGYNGNMTRIWVQESWCLLPFPVNMKQENRK